MSPHPLDDVGEEVGEKVPTSFSPMVEFGVTGLKRTAGYVDEEFLPALRGRKAVQVFREMSHNDAIVGSLLFAIDKLVREVEWRVEPCDQTPENAAAAEFVEQCMNDMSHSWDDFISEALSMLVYGWSWHEIVYKKRVGPWEKDGAKKSKHTDHLIGWRKIPIRSQETMMRWVFDDSGGIKGMVQQAPPKYVPTVLPINKSLLFRTAPAKGNPEGKSLLRNAYRSWYFKKRLEEFEGIGIERDLAGMPVAKVPADYLAAPKGSEKAKIVDGFRKMVRGVRRDENEGLVLPIQYDGDTKQPLFDFELMASAGTRQFDTNSIIQRYEQRILMTVLADFILVGHEQTGSYSLHTDKTGIFRAALNSITKIIADTLNRHAIPKLFEANAWLLDELPKITPSEIDPPDLAELAQFISATAGAGMQWFPDPELEKFVRDIARLPEIPDDVYELKRAQAEQMQAMEFAQSEMEMMGLQQRAEMVGEGYTPEQAEVAATTPTAEMQLWSADVDGKAEAMRQEHQMGLEQQRMEMAANDPTQARAHQMQLEQLAAQDQSTEAKFRQQLALLQAQDYTKDKDLTRAEKQTKLDLSAEEKRAKLEGQRSEKQGRLTAAQLRAQDVAENNKHTRAKELFAMKSKAAAKKPDKKPKKK